MNMMLENPRLVHEELRSDFLYLSRSLEECEKEEQKMLRTAVIFSLAALATTASLIVGKDNWMTVRGIFLAGFVISSLITGYRWLDLWDDVSRWDVHIARLQGKDKINIY